MFYEHNQQTNTKLQDMIGKKITNVVYQLDDDGCEEVRITTNDGVYIIVSSEWINFDKGKS